MNLKEIRKKKKLRLVDIADILKISEGQASRIENQLSNLSSDQIIKLCLALKCSSDYLLGLIDNDIKK